MTVDRAALFSKTVVIEGFEYDVTAFAAKHPGGDVILSSIGTDASAAFKEFHNNSKKAKLVLASLPRRPVTDQAPKLQQRDVRIMKEFAEWRSSLQARGFFKASAMHCTLRLLELAVWAALGCLVMAIKNSPVHIGLAVICFTIFNVRCGWLQHEAGHNSFTTNLKIDKLVQSVVLGLGLSSTGWQWNHTHNQHHATPQKVNLDSDLDTLPLVAYFKGAVEQLENKRLSGTLGGALWLRLQALTFLPISCGAALAFLIYVRHPLSALKNDHLGLAIMAATHVLKPMAFVVFAGTSFAQGYGLFLLTYWLTSMYLFSHFAMSHTFTPVVEESDNPSWVRFAVEHTVDISPESPAVNWVMGYLNCQVIHHLFPTMPQFRQPQVHRELLKLARDWGLEYRVMGYWDSWKAMMMNLHEVGRHYYSSHLQNGPTIPSAVGAALPTIG